jgi:hypothetical protein
MLYRRYSCMLSTTWLQACLLSAALDVQLHHAKRHQYMPNHNLGRAGPRAYVCLLIISLLHLRMLAACVMHMRHIMLYTQRYPTCV